MADTLPRLTPAVFLVVLISFSLPWVGFTCQGEETVTVSGLRLMTGTTIERQVFGERQVESVESQPWVIVTFAISLIGLMPTLFPSRARSLLILIASLVALGSHSVSAFAISIDSLPWAIFRRGAELLCGFWAASAGLAVAFFCAVYGLKRQRKGAQEAG